MFDDFLRAHEVAIRLGVFLGSLLLFSLAEFVRPTRTNRSSRKLSRYFNNLALGGVNSVVLRAAPTLLATQVAISAENNGWGLTQFVSDAFFIHSSVAIILWVIFLDFAIYWQHRTFHVVPWFWRFHRVHHSDAHLDTSSALRFHPLEIVISMAYKSILTILFGIPFAAILIFEVILNAAAIFNHANISLSSKWEKRLNRIVVTPDFHRIHHSTERKLSDSNYGFFLSIWDRFFTSSTPVDTIVQTSINIGNNEVTKHKVTKVGDLLVQPLK